MKSIMIRLLLPLVTLCLGFVPSSVAAQNPTILRKFVPRLPAPTATKGKGMTCLEATRYAIKRNPSFRAFRAKALIAMKRLNASRIFPTNPELESVGKGKANLTKFGAYQFYVGLTWKFPIGGHWTRRQLWAKRIFERVQSEIKAAQFTLTLKVQKECFGLLLAQQKLALYRSMIGFYKKVLDLITKRKKSGLATIIDVNLARLELLQSQASLSLALAKVKTKRLSLAEAIGWTGSTLPQVVDKITNYTQVKAKLVTLQKQALQQHILLKVLKKRITETQANLQWANAKAIPDLKIKLYYAWQEGDHLMGGGIAIPLPFFQRNQEKRWTTRAKLRQSRLKLHALRFKIRQRVAQAYVQFLAGWKVFQLYETQLIPTMKQQTQLQVRGLKAGALSILKVISAQQSQNKASLKRIASLQQVFNSFLTLQKAIGGFL